MQMKRLSDYYKDNFDKYDIISKLMKGTIWKRTIHRRDYKKYREAIGCNLISCSTK